MKNKVQNIKVRRMTSMRNDVGWGEMLKWSGADIQHRTD